MMHRTVFIAVTLSFMVACSSSGTSSVEGTLDAASFATTPQSLTATDETGAATTISLLTGGAFAAKLASGHTYSLAVETAAGTVPLLFPRTTGQLDATFVLDSSNAVVSLGTVQAVDHMPANGIQVSADALESTVTTASDGGVTDDTQVTVCAEKHEHFRDGGCPGMSGAEPHQGNRPPRPPPSADGGLPAGPRQGDPSKPFCYPQHAPPSTVDCGPSFTGRHGR